MPDTVRTTSELLTLMADNPTGDISAQDLRDMIVSVINVEDLSALVLNDTPLAGEALRVIRVNAGETALEFADPVVDTDTDQFADLTDTPADFVAQALKLLRVNAAEDGVEFIAQPKRIYQVMCGFKDPGSGSYLEWCNQQGSDETGYCVIRAGTIIAASVNRTDADDATIEIRTPGGDTALFTTDNQTIFDPLSIAVAAGDRIRARNTGPNTAQNVVLSLLIEED